MTAHAVTPPSADLVKLVDKTAAPCNLYIDSTQPHADDAYANVLNSAFTFIPISEFGIEP